MASSPSPTRVVAVVCPVAAVALTGAAVALGGSWPSIAAVLTAALCVLLAGVVIAVERRRRLEVARTRATQARAYDQLHAEHVEEHRSVTEHLVGLLETTEASTVCLRARLDEVQGALGSTQQAVLRSELGAARAQELRASAERRATLAQRSAAQAEALLAEVVAAYEGTAAALESRSETTSGAHGATQAEDEALECLVPDEPARPVEPLLVEPMVAAAAPVEVLARTA